MCYLPADWVFPKSVGMGEPLDENNWPLKMLRQYVDYVAATRNWVSYSHGIPNVMSEPHGEPFIPSTKLSHVVLLRPDNEEEGFSCCKVKRKKVQFLLVVPVTSAEAAWKREVGIDASLYYCIGSKAIGGENVMIDYVIDPQRPCAVMDLGAKEKYAEDDEDGWEDVDDEEEEEEGTGGKP
jgi:hypothetical protein